jgi:hypothetical protein
MFISTFVLHVILMFVMSAFLYLNDDLILNRKRKNKNDDCHDHNTYNENEIIDANV